MRLNGLKVVYSAAAALALVASTVVSFTPSASAGEIMVMIVDMEAPGVPGNPEQGSWGYSPFHVNAVKGDTIMFMQGENAFRPHTVTSITWTGQAPARELASAKTFDSSPSQAEYLQKGMSWTLDTAGLDPGQHVYYCTIHPWMVGTISLAAPAAETPATADVEVPTGQ
jgi:plastocyanin